MIAVRPDACYLGTTPVKEVRKGTELVLAPRGEELWYKANEIPSLDLRFADTKSLVDATTGNNLVTFARGGSGTYVGSDGLIKTATTNEPRFTHDPVTGESLGLLVEEQRVNLLQRTEEFNQAPWSISGLIAFGSGSAVNASLAPDGNTTAELIKEDTSGSLHTITQNVTTSAGATVTFSVFAKAAGRNFLRLVLRDNSSPFDSALCFFDLSSGTPGSPIVSGAGLQGGCKVEDYGDGWYRCSLTGSVPGATTYRLDATLANSISNAAYTGDGASGIYLWGAQLEAGAFPTSYIKNIDNPLGATRAADVVSIDGANYTSFYQEGPLTLFVAGKQLMPITDGRVLVGIRATSNVFGDAPYISRTDSNFSAFGAVNLNLSTSVTETGATFRTAGALDANNGRMAASGVLSTLDASCSLPVSTQGMTIGQRSWASSGNFANATISRVMYWPQRLPDSTLQAITL